MTAPLVRRSHREPLRRPAATRARRTPGLRRAAGRSGFTLLEMMLVLVLLSIVAAMSWPSLTAGMSRQALQAGADQLRGAWVQARVRAMTDGRTMLFWYELGTGRYVVQPWSADSGDAASADLTGIEFGNANDLPAANASAVIERTLPEGVIFATGRSEADDRAQGEYPAAPPVSAGGGPGNGNGGAGTGGLGGGTWGQPIFFHPDGTASTTSVALGNDRQRFILVTLRGLTGTTRHSDVLTEEELP